MATLTRYGIPAMLLLGLSFIVYAWLSASSTPKPANGLQSYAKGSMKGLEFPKDAAFFPDEAFYGPDGEALKLTDLGAKVYVVNLWETNCPPCVYEMPTLADLQDAYPESDLKVVALSFNRKNDHPMAKEKLADLTDDRLDFYGAENLNLLFTVKARGFPTTIVYDAEGREIARYEGDTEWASEKAIAFFDHLVGKDEEADQET